MALLNRQQTGIVSYALSAAFLATAIGAGMVGTLTNWAQEGVDYVSQSPGGFAETDAEGIRCAGLTEGSEPIPMNDSEWLYFEFDQSTVLCYSESVNKYAFPVAGLSLVFAGGALFAGRRLRAPQNDGNDGQGSQGPQNPVV